MNGIVDEHVTEGQLNDSGLTLGDIQIIRASFIETLKGRFHVRVKYPGNEQLMVDEPPATMPAVEPQPASETSATPDNGQPEAAPTQLEPEEARSSNVGV